MKATKLVFKGTLGWSVGPESQSAESQRGAWRGRCRAPLCQGFWDRVGMVSRDFKAPAWVLGGRSKKATYQMYKAYRGYQVKLLSQLSIQAAWPSTGPELLHRGF